MLNNESNTALTLISQYGDEAEAIAMLRAAEFAANLNNDEWIKWEKIIKEIETIDRSSILDG